MGWFVEKKAPLDVLRAFGLCHEVCPEAELTMIGGGLLAASARGLAESLGIADSVMFLGEQPHARVNEELRRAGVFVQHSVMSALGDMEGWPVSIGEASASALPVLATRHGDIPRQVIEGVSSLLEGEHDWRGMGEAMVKLAKDPALCERFGRAGREHMQRSFVLGGQIEQLEDVLRGSLSGL